MAKKIGIINRKGGVSKSTTAAHLGHGLALMGHKVLIVDTDTQGQAGIFFDVTPDKMLTDYIDGLPMDDVIIPMRENLDLLGADRTISKISKWISAESINPQLYLSRKLKDLDSHYDFILIDGSPGFNDLSVNVLFYADELIIPVSLQLLSVQGLASFIDEINEMQDLAETDINYRILPTMADGRVKQSGELLEELQEIFKDKLMEPIRYSANLAKCPSYGKTVYEFAPGDRGAQDYVSMVEAI